MTDAGRRNGVETCATPWRIPRLGLSAWYILSRAFPAVSEAICMPQVFRVRSIFAIGTLLSLLAAVVAAAAILVARQAEDQRWVRHTLEVQVRLSRIHSLLQDAETAQRGYLITGKPRFAAEFDSAADATPGELDALRAAINDNSTQVESLGRLRSQAADRIGFLRQAIELQQRGASEDATALIKTGKGKELMDQTMRALDGMLAEEERLLVERTSTSNATALWAQVTGGLSFLCAVLVGLFVIRDARKKVRALASANAALLDAAAQASREAAKRQSVEDQLRQAQKMEAVGQLTGGIAHDFNNMLAVIMGSLELMRRRLARGDSDILRFVDNAMDGAQRAATLTLRLLAFSRQQPLVPSIIDPNVLVRGMEELLRRTIGETIRLQIVQAGGLWRTMVDGSQLENAILNLAVNARDAMEGGGNLTIETFNASLDEAYPDAQVDLPPGQYVAVAVSDNGAGMAPEVAAKAFDPFFTTKEVGKGSGLGLSQVFGFVKQSKGHVKIYSEPGQGTTVKIYLPRYAGQENPMPATPAANFETTPNGAVSEIVVVVEDEEKVRRMAVDALRELGYTVAHAGGGGEGLRVIEKIGRVTLLLTDIVMPGMNGKQLADEVRSRFPDIKILFTTGYTRNAVIHNGQVDADVNFLAKPFTVGQLAAKVRKVIDATNI
jgi:signal transduction histidine kinase/CheY-like chemotaxis protein